MNKKDYLYKILALCTGPQKDLFDRMYKDGVTPKQLDWAISQVERTLLDLNNSVKKLKDIEKEFNIFKEESNKAIIAVNSLLNETYNELASANATIERLSNPISLNNADIQERLDKLDALEAGGVDNWEGYYYALHGDD